MCKELNIERTVELSIECEINKNRTYSGTKYRMCKEIKIERTVDLNIECAKK